MKDCHVRMCAPFSECISRHKPHSYVQIHFYYAYFSWLIFSQNKLLKKENPKCFQLTLFWAYALQNYHMIKSLVEQAFILLICLFT